MLVAAGIVDAIALAQGVETVGAHRMALAGEHERVDDALGRQWRRALSPRVRQLRKPRSKLALCMMSGGIGDEVEQFIGDCGKERVCLSGTRVLRP